MKIFKITVIKLDNEGGKEKIPTKLPESFLKLRTFSSYNVS